MVEITHDLVPCVFVRVDCRHPNQGDGTSSSNRSREASAKSFVSFIFKWNGMKVVNVLLCYD